MIIKFDHFSYVEKRTSKEILLSREKINKFSFVELGLHNINIKKDLMRSWQEDHDIYFFQDENSLPIEYIFYDTVGPKNNIIVKDDVILGNYKSKDEACLFLESIFGKRVISIGDRIRCNMKGILDKRDVWLELQPGYNSSVFLDDKGGGDDCSDNKISI